MLGGEAGEFDIQCIGRPPVRRGNNKADDFREQGSHRLAAPSYMDIAVKNLRGFVVLFFHQRLRTSTKTIDKVKNMVSKIKKETEDRLSGLFQK